MPAKTTYLYFPQNAQTSSRAHPASDTMDVVGVYSGGEAVVTLS